MQDNADILKFSKQCSEAEVSVSERELVSQDIFCISNGALFHNNAEVFTANVFEGNGNFEIKENSAFANFSGKQDSYQIKINLPIDQLSSNGLSVSFKVSGWGNIRYIAIGHTSAGVFRHTKIFNIKQDEIVNVNLGYSDIAFGLQNHWSKFEAEQINDVRVYVSGESLTTDASIEIFWASRWNENGDLISHKLEKYTIQRNEELFKSLKKYFRKCNPYLDLHAETFLRIGTVPVAGDVYLEWPHYLKKPEMLKDSGSYAYTWHAMHFAISLMVYGVDHNRIESIVAARDFINEWLSNSFYQADNDKKYTWYDHGTAERLISFIFMHHLGMLHNFDIRFMSKLRYAIVKHTQLLESEFFYSYHQNTRYHNHAWFQDMSLIAASIALASWPASERWLQTGKTRLEDQLNNLITRDAGFAVFVENSIGYHLGVQRLTEFAGELISLSNARSVIPDVSLELNAWSEFFKYPTSIYPATGDSFKKSCGKRKSSGKLYKNTGLYTLRKAGYVVLKNNYLSRPAMLTMLGTSLCKTHKHEDNLAVTFFYDGVEWLTDPSFYSHKYDSPVPAYLRSAEAHSCIFIPSMEYSLEPNLCKLDSSEQDDSWIISGEHICYDGIKIIRTITVPKDRLEIQGTDEIQSEKSYDTAYLVFHFGEGVVVSEIDDGYMLSHNHADTKAVLKVSKENCEVVTGMNFPERSSIIGIGFEELVESTSICIRLKSFRIEWNITFIEF